MDFFLEMKTSVLHACGFFLAPISILLMWVDLWLPYQGLMLFFFFVFLPFLRWAWPIDLVNDVDDSAIPEWINKSLYWAPNLFAVMWLLSAGTLPFIVQIERQSALHILGVWLSIWVALSLALPACHELIHRKNSEGLLGRLLGGCLGLFSFTEEHRVHHAKSGRGQDPDCAERHESVYAYAWRSGLQAVVAGWDYEIAQQARKGRPWWTNRILWTGTVTVFFGLLWAWAQGVLGFLFYLTIVLAANFSLRAITFIQHWGLRQVPLIADGHGVSWVSTCAFQSWFTFNIALHDQHHHQPTRTYWRLCSLPSELKLPVTYPLAFLLSLLPPLYRKVMSARLDLWLDGACQGRPQKLPETCVIQ